MSTPVEVVNVLCDTVGKVNGFRPGALSYLVPSNLTVTPGDAVEVPYGKKQLHGVVIGPGDPKMATREIIQVHGKRVSQEDLEIAKILADMHFSDLATIASRLSPRNGRGAQPLDAGVVSLKEEEVTLPTVDEEVTRRLYLKAPLVSSALLAATEAKRLSLKGQVLILCPSVESLEKVLKLFKTGAARLDVKAPMGAWKGFAEGTLKVGVGTRSAALYSGDDLKSIIVIDEDHPGHFEATQPYTNARDIANLRTSKANIDLTLITSNPTTSAVGSNVKVIPIGNPSTSWPKMQIVNRDDFAPTERMLPPNVVNLTNKAVKENTPVFVLAQTQKASRRCKKCSVLRPCQECSSSLCKHQEVTPCVSCGETKTMILGWDKEKVQNVFKTRATVVTISELNEIENEKALVIIFDIDAALNSPSLTPEALPQHIIMSSAKAAGTKGQLVVLTRQKDNLLLQNLCVKRNQVEAARRNWEAAKAMNLPPFGKLITIKVGRVKAPNVSNLPGQVHGPRKTGDGWEILVRCGEKDMKKLSYEIDKIRRPGKTRVTVL